MTISWSALGSRVVNGALVVCAMAMTGMVGWRTFYNVPPHSIRPRDLPVVRDWGPLFAVGQRVGQPTGQPAFVVFSDYECPACRTLNDRLRARRAAGDSAFSVIYRHLPLPSHRFAELAAVASECGAEQGAYTQMHDALFASQSQFGIKPWRGIAEDAGVSDLDRFDVCMKGDRALHRVREDAAVATQIGVQATPTLIYPGGRQFAGVPAPSLLDSLLQTQDSNRRPK